MPATLWLEFSRPGAVTHLRVRRQEVPWRVLRGFPNPSGETLAHLSNISGGILDTDDLALRVDVQRGARAQLTSTGATRVYRSRGPERVSRSRVDVEVGEDAFLEYVPDALIPFGGARYEQRTFIRMRRGASLIWWEMISPGRQAAGELFRYSRLASRFAIWNEGGPILEECWNIAPGDGSIESAVRLGPFPYFASLYVCGVGAVALETELSELAQRHSVANELLWGAGSLRSDGVVVRGAARNGRLLSRSLTLIWEAAKLSLCGRVATHPRKIY